MTVTTREVTGVDTDPHHRVTCDLDKERSGGVSNQVAIQVEGTLQSGERSINTPSPE